MDNLQNKLVQTAVGTIYLSTCRFRTGLCELCFIIQIDGERLLGLQVVGQGRTDFDEDRNLGGKLSHLAGRE